MATFLANEIGVRKRLVQKFNHHSLGFVRRNVKEHSLGLTVTLTALMGTVPSLAHAEESVEVQPAIATSPQVKSSELEVVSTHLPTVEATTKVEFSTPIALSSTSQIESIPQIESDRQKQRSMILAAETKWIAEFSTRAESIKTPENQKPATPNVVVVETNLTTTAQSATPNSKSEVIGSTSIQAIDLQAPAPIEQPTVELTQDNTDDTLPNKLQRLEERQKQLEQQIDTLKQQLSNSAQSSPKAAVTVPEDRPSALTIYAQPMFLRVNPATSLDFAIVDPGTALATSGELATVDYDRATALRIGASYRPQNTAWEIGGNHTFFNTDGTASAVRPANGFLFSTLSHPLQNDSAETADAKAKFNYNVTDAELAYNFKVGRGLGVRLFSGLRFSDIRQSMAVTYNGRDYTNGRLDMTNDFRGFGPRLGAEARVLMGGGFSLFTRGSAALLFGKQSSSFRETDRNGADVIADLGRDRSQTVPVVDLAIGLDWVQPLSKSAKLNLSLGYEYQQWFNVMDNIRFVDAASPGVFAQSQSNLSLHGFFVKTGLQFEF
jgi:Legionella pneumophila major outer membrane protein precursor